MKKRFQINIKKDVLHDLQKRLASTRWTNEIENDKWQTGTSKAYLQKLCKYWQNNFDWKKQEAYLNTFNHYTTIINDCKIHFIHEKGKGKKTIPLLLTHGYPDSFIRFHKLIPLLTKADEKDFSFDVIVPSIPGYAFSEIPKEEGMNTTKIADLWAELMTKELGYEKFAAHGGDWGGSITEKLALYHSKNLLCIHLTDVPFAHSLEEVKDGSPAEKKFFDKLKKWQQTEGAYAMIQGTKPQSLAFGLNDSPTGLAGWLIEKFYAWSDNDGNIDNAFTKDELLTNCTIYWATQTINSAIRIYYEEIKAIMQAKYNPLVKLNPFDKTGDKSDVPAAFAIFPKDISLPPREFAERFFNVERWTEMKQGGHFAALEQTELLANDIRLFMRNSNFTS